MWFYFTKIQYVENLNILAKAAVAVSVCCNDIIFLTDLFLKYKANCLSAVVVVLLVLLKIRNSDKLSKECEIPIALPV